MSYRALAVFSQTTAIASVSFLPGEPVHAAFRQIRVVGPMGPQGPAGAGGGAGDLLVNAAKALSGHRAVLLTAVGTADYPDLSAPLDGGLIAGVTTGAAAAGAEIAIRTGGLLSEPSWAWTRGPVFAGDNGVLTQVPPAGAWVRQIGVAVSATQINIAPNPVILT